MFDTVSLGPETSSHSAGLGGLWHTPDATSFAQACRYPVTIADTPRFVAMFLTVSLHGLHFERAWAFSPFEKRLC